MNVTNYTRQLNMNTIILPYAKTSISSKVLAKTLGCKRIAIRRSTYRHPRGRKVINWGSQRVYEGIPDADFINHPSSIKLASNKIKTLETLTEAGVPTLGFTLDRDVAQEALDNMDTNAIYVRHKLSSNSGRGIELIKYGEQVPEAPLYTYDLYKWTEWRLHIGLISGAPHTIRIQQKVKRDAKKSDAQTDPIRNHGEDYVFRIQDLNVLDKAQMQTVGADALSALGLDFAALDMAHTADGWKVIEANTACGLAGATTKLDYKRYFEELILS